MAEPPEWVDACSASLVPDDGGVCVIIDDVQIAVFHLIDRDGWYAVQNRCPHWHEMVLARGLTGDHEGEPKVACPMHKRTFSLTTGRCTTGEPFELRTFAVRVVDGTVQVARPTAAVVAEELAVAAAAAVGYQP